MRALPPLPVSGAGVIVGGKKGDTGVAAADGAGIGWLYTVSTGTIVANTGTATADDGVTLYSDF